MITLEVLTGQAAGAVFELEGPVLSIGRAPSNQVVLPDYHLSGEHGQIFREDDRYIYRDLRSTNGSRIQRGETELVLDGSSDAARWEAPLQDGDRLVLGNPAEPVVLVCRVRLDENEGAERQEVLAQRTLSELPELQGKIERDPTRAAALYNVSKKLGRRGLDLQAVFEGLCEALFELMPRATHVTIDLADDTDGRMNTVWARARGHQ